MRDRPDLIDTYLQRLGIDRAPLRDLSGLQQLHRAHVSRVPYEDLGGCAVARTDVTALLDRVVRQRRGGTAAELNFAFAMLLVGLGFTVTPLRVTAPSDQYRAVNSRLALAVTIDATAYFADVSGTGADGPLALGTGDWQADSAGEFKVVGDWRHQQAAILSTRGVRYTIEPASSATDALTADDLVPAGRPSTRRHPPSPVLSLRRQRGRTALIGTRLIETNGPARTDIELRSDQVRPVLHDRFGVRLTADEERCLCSSGR